MLETRETNCSCSMVFVLRNMRLGLFQMANNQRKMAGETDAVGPCAWLTHPVKFLEEK